jgi:hypothetical protein
MAFFPQSSKLVPIYGYRPLKIENVKRPPSESGKSQARDVWGQTRLMPQPIDFELVRADKENVRQFWAANRTGTWYFYDYDTEDVTTAQNIGIGDGSNKTFTVLARQISAYTVYDNGTPVSSSSFTVNVGTGPNGEDQVVFTTAPTSGHAITIIYTGRLRYLAEFYQPIEIEPLTVSVWRVRVFVRQAF